MCTSACLIKKPKKLDPVSEKIRTYKIGTFMVAGLLLILLTLFIVFYSLGYIKYNYEFI